MRASPGSRRGWSSPTAATRSNYSNAAPGPGAPTYSFRDEQTGDEVDNGQHVFMQCTTAYTAFLERIGTLELTHRQQRLHVPVFDEDGRRSDLRAANLPLGLHLAPALLRYRHLTWRQKAQVARAFLALRLLGRAERARLDDLTFEEWLRGRGQSPGTIREFWDFLVIPTLNCRAEQASARQALFVVEEGFQRDPGAAALGVATVGLSRLHVEPAVRAIEARGGTLTTRAPIERIEVEDARVAALVLRGGGAAVLRRVRERPRSVAAAAPAARPRARRGSVRRTRAIRGGLDPQRPPLVRPAGRGLRLRRLRTLRGAVGVQPQPRER